jgi:hypothetical protein
MTTPEWTRPTERWRLLAPDDVTVVRSGRLAGREATVRQLRALQPGAPVVLLDERPGGRARTRRLALAGRIAVERGYVAVPSLRNPIVFAEDSVDCLRWVSRSVLTTPPGVTWLHAVVDAGIRLLRRRPHLLGSLASGRVVVGRRV